MRYTLFAAIEVGSSELSMKIYQISKKTGILEVDYVRYALEIGAETYTTKKISHETISKICEILLDFCRIMKSYNITEYMAVGTSALREANNNIMVLDRIKLTTGLKVKILSNSEKRFLYYKALALRGDEFNQVIENGTAVVDVGAGSIQISLYDKGAMISTQNIQLGFLRIMEILNDFNEKMKNYHHLIDEYIHTDFKTYKEMFLKEIDLSGIIALGDNMCEFSKLCLEKVQTQYLSCDEFKEYYDKLVDLKPEALSKKMNITVEQATLLLPTAMVYKKMFEITNAKTIWFPDVSFNDGIAVEFAQKNSGIISVHDFSADIILAAKNIADKYRCDIPHVNHVEFTTLKMFDALKKVHGMGKRERILARLAAILHNCGAFINLNEVPINSYNIIMSTEIIGLSHSEREIVANIIRYLTSDMPKYTEIPGITDREGYIKISKISSILRLADALDISHMQKFDKMKIEISEGIMTVIVDNEGDLTLEKGMFQKNATYFAEVYGISPKIKQKRKYQ